MKNLLFFFSLLKYWLKREEPFFKLYLENKKVLDLGCGEGKLLKKNPQLIYGVDINENRIQELKQQGLKAEVGLVTETPFASNFFEAVYCSNIIEHLYPDQAHQMLVEIKRLLKPGGVLILISPMPKTVWNTFGHIKPYPPMSIKKIFRKISLESFESVSGLSIEKVFYYGTAGGNKFSFLITTFLGVFFDYFRGSYAMVIKKSESA